VPLVVRELSTDKLGKSKVNFTEIVKHTGTLANKKKHGKTTEKVNRGDSFADNTGRLQILVHISKV
jgi:hypothetical protein